MGGERNKVPLPREEPGTMELEPSQEAETMKDSETLAEPVTLRDTGADGENHRSDLSKDIDSQIADNHPEQVDKSDMTAGAAEVRMAPEPSDEQEIEASTAAEEPAEKRAEQQQPMESESDRPVADQPTTRSPAQAEVGSASVGTHVNHSHSKLSSLHLLLQIFLFASTDP